MRRFSIPPLMEFANVAQPLCMPLFLGTLTDKAKTHPDFYVLQSVHHDLEAGDFEFEYICHQTCQRLVFSTTQVARQLTNGYKKKFLETATFLSSRLFAFACDKPNLSQKMIGYTLPPENMRAYYESATDTTNQHPQRSRYLLQQGAFALPLHPFIIDRNRPVDPFDENIEPSRLMLLKL